MFETDLIGIFERYKLSDIAWGEQVVRPLGTDGTVAVRPDVAPMQACQAICAVANAGGGSLVCASPSGAPEGAYAAVGTLLQSRSQLTPRVRPVVTRAEAGGFEVACVEVPRPDALCYYSGLGPREGAYKLGGARGVERMGDSEVAGFLEDPRRSAESEPQEGLDERCFSPALRAAFEAGALSMLPQGELADDSLLVVAGLLTRDGAPTLAGLLALCPQVLLREGGLSISGRKLNALGEVVESREVCADVGGAAEAAALWACDTSSLYGPGVCAPPLAAVREALLNAVLHRSYARADRVRPVELTVEPGSVTVESPGGLLGSPWPGSGDPGPREARNPRLLTAHRAMDPSRPRRRGIERMRRSLEEAGMPSPLISWGPDRFTVCLGVRVDHGALKGVGPSTLKTLAFCRVPRSREEIASNLGLRSPRYASLTVIAPAVAAGLLDPTLPDKPKSKFQRYVTPPDVLYALPDPRP